MDEPHGRQRFSVDIPGLLAALTEQFPEPLLCVRELVQNAADAGARRIDVDVAHDARRGLFRIQVHDDGRGMNAQEVEGYLTIGFSDKDPTRARGRFGVGKLSPYALGITRMVVETSDGRAAHRITFGSDGTGQLQRTEARPRGTAVRVYKQATRAEAERLTERTFQLVRERCGSLTIPLYVNGQQVNRTMGLPTAYAWSFAAPEGEGVIGLLAEPVQQLMGGGIVLETGAPILGEEVSYVLDSPRLAPTLSRNAVRRDHAFESLLRVAQAGVRQLEEQAARNLAARIDALRSEDVPVERSLEPDDRAALEWLRSRLLSPDVDEPSAAVRLAPVLETADGDLVSFAHVLGVAAREARLPTSRVPRTRDELSAYVDRGVPVLLLYRDLEDFLERRRLTSVEVDCADDGLEIAPGDYSPGEHALAHRSRRPRRAGAPRLVTAAVAACAGLAVVTWHRPPSPSRAAAPPMVDVAAAGATSPAPSSAPLGIERGLPAPAPAVATVGAPPELAGPRGWLRGSVTLLGLVGALLSLSLAFAWMALRPRRGRRERVEAALGFLPITVGDTGARRLDVLRRALLNPIDFLVARGWSMRAAGARPLGGSHVISGYRELAPELPIRSGVRLDLDRLEVGFVDLLSSVGEPHDGRVLLRRGQRVLLNRNHPTVRDLIRLAGRDEPRARLLLEALLATDPDLARGTDPRQAEWDLLGRAEAGLRGAR